MSQRPSEMHAAAIVPITDLARSREFYEGKLGLEGRETPGGWRLRADYGTEINLLEVPPGEGATWPLATFRVDDVTATVRELRARGVDFLGPGDLPFSLDDEGVSRGQDGLEVAWMRDPDGNILTIYALR